MNEGTAVRLQRVSLSDQAGLPLAEESLAPAGEWPPLVWLVGAHGGAGVTTLARTLAPCGDAGQQWPDKDESPWCVIVARTTRTGVEAAHEAALQAQVGKAGQCRVLGVVLVDDTPGKTPKSVEQKMAIIKKIVPTIWRVPYVPAWREVLTSELPEWSPLEEASDAKQDKISRLKRRKKSLSALDVVPLSIRRVGEDLVELAQEANSRL